MPITLIVAIIVFIIFSAWAFYSFYTRHIQGQGAQEQTVEITVLDKQTIDVPDAQPGQEDQEFWIYVQKGRLGPKREFQVGVHYYHALNPGDKGTLTYQGDKFLHFALKR
ncbi:hypothetical protein VISI1226_16218 [Vibrio sinaloensis DSM 21326]|uniref:Uncharacterized protein n=1 Tax=Vibrio sinaloensis DSM 21326 TaxID=945550 RepID=E8MDP7_PHOS4|nr:DUF2500 domain-containing protein [Vibrio sinaloensis]EGA67839.1 hypothetical protein VISI1226_16218 [Vibrio sinaloensis DSM 21326]